MLTSKLIVDYREKSLSQKLKQFNIEFSLENLIIGDCLIKENDTIQYLFERKTVNDWIQSIKDGRMHEQKKRILETISSNCCFYLLEGELFEKNGYHNTPKSTIISSLTNKMVKDNIFVYKSQNISETAEFIQIFWNKYLKGDFKKIKDNKISNLNLVPRKKSNITTNDCFQTQLSCIPSISKVKIEKLSNEFSNMSDLILRLNMMGPEKAKSFLSTLKIGNKNMGPKSAEKIILFLGL